LIISRSHCNINDLYKIEKDARATGDYIFHFVQH